MVQSYEHPKSSIRAYLSLVPQFILQGLRSIYTLVQLLQQRKAWGWSLKQTFAASFLKSSTVHPLQARLYTPTTGEATQRFCARNGLRQTVRSLDCGERFPAPDLHEIEMPDVAQKRHVEDGKIILYFHGGGYMNPISEDGHLPLLIECGRRASAQKLFLLEYTLTPELKYPGQLVQAVEALRYLLEDRHLQPSQITIGGDSAGGHLVLALLAHLQSPHPKIHAINGLSRSSGKSLGAAFCFSPWVTLPYTAASFSENQLSDFITKPNLDMYLAHWQPKSEAWGDFLEATTAEFWRDVPVERLFLTAGGAECFRDDITAMAQLLRQSNNDVTLAVGAGEIHVQGVINAAVKMPQAGSSKAIFEWLAQRREK